MVSSEIRSAFIPFDHEVGYERAVALAAAYFNEFGLRPVIVAPNKAVLEFNERLKHYSKGRDVVTPMNENRSRVGHGVPVLIYVPALKELELGLRHANGAPVVVIEDQFNSCVAWADETGAINLLEAGKVHAVDRTPEHEELLEAIDFAGNNGWSDDYGKRDLRKLLAEAKRAGWLNKDDIVAYQLVKGRHHHYHSLVYLQEEIDKAAG
ncbi:hypothetical protein [Rhodococcus sp. USK13]|uniref:hypothetical protein n=1 Tax=Rhodococcus sp. USK13 TaxID=2806442 RepID=UPI001BCF2095|nr:hypothetical protein [Rhodococcus sp. USK13]